MKYDDNKFANLPSVATDYIRLVIKKMGYRRKVREDVQAELIAHFEDALASCANEKEKEEAAQKLIAEFGDPKLIGILARRAKKRCRPLWQKILIHGFQFLGILILYVIICSVPLFIGKPTIKTSYLDLLNSTIPKGPDPCENAQLYYNKAASLLPEDIYKITSMPKTWPGDFNDTKRAELAKWLADSKPALDLMRQGAHKPFCRSIYDANLSIDQEKQLEAQRVLQGLGQKSSSRKLLEMGGWADPAREAIMANELPSLNKDRQLARRMLYQILYEAYIGDVNAAVTDCIVLHKFSQHKEGKGLLVEQLVGIAIDAMTISCAFTIMEKTDVSSNGLLELQNEFESSLVLRQPVIDFESEKAAWLDIVQRCFTDDGKGNGRMLKYGLPLMATTSKSVVGRFLTMQFPSRRETLAKINTFFDEAQCRMRKTPWELHKEGAVEYPWWQGNIVLLEIMGPACDKVSQSSWRLNCSCNAVITTAAILRYKHEKGIYPPNFEELLTAGYLKEIPMDPYSDKPLVYKKTDNNFTLYSFGTNFIDDGGTTFYNEKDTPVIWSDPNQPGDAVFWPVPKNKSAS